MAVPGYQDFMLPLLKVASDGQEHTVAGAMDQLAQQFEITQADRDELLPSGTQTRLYNRVTWALTYLSKSLLLEKTGRGRFRIAPRGNEVLVAPPPRVDNAYLDPFPEYRSFKTKRAELAGDTRRATALMRESEDPGVTPDERLDAAYK